MLTKTAVPAQLRAVYRAYVEDEMPLDEVSAKFGVTEAAIYKIKSRVERMAAIIEKRIRRLQQPQVDPRSSEGEELGGHERVAGGSAGVRREVAANRPQLRNKAKA